MYIRVSVGERVAGGTKGDLGKEGEEERKEWMWSELSIYLYEMPL